MNSAICALFLIRYEDFMVLVTLTAILLSDFVNIQWEISRLAISANFPIVSQSLLCSILTADQQQLGLFLLSSAVSSGHRQ